MTSTICLFFFSQCIGGQSFIIIVCVEVKLLRVFCLSFDSPVSEKVPMSVTIKGTESVFFKFCLINFKVFK